MEILQQENTSRAILLPKYFSDQIIKQYDKIYDIDKQQLESLQTYCEMIQSENTFEMHKGLVGLRYMISNEPENLILESKLQIVCELNILKNIIHIIEYNKIQLILFEALWIIVNLSSGSSQIVDQIIENGSINCIIQKFATGDYHNLIIEQVCWIFANVTSDSIENRDYMFRQGTLKILNKYAIERVKDFKNLKLIELLSWSISNHFRFGPMSLLKDKQVSLQFFSNWIQQDFTPEILQDICSSFFQFLDYKPDQIQTIIDLGIIPRIIELSETENQQIFLANINILNQILESYQYHQEYLFGIGVFQCLGRLIKKYIQSHEHLNNILQTFVIISRSKYLSSRLLSSDELDQILSLINQDEIQIQDKVYYIIENLIKDYDIKSMDLIQNKKIINLCKIFVSKDLIKMEKLKLCNIVLDLCEAYLKDERFNQFKEELLELKHQIIQKLQLLNDQSI